MFSNSAAYEAKQKALLGKHRFAQNKQVFDVLIERTLRLVEHTDIPYFVVNEELQQGDTFGKRISNSAKWAFNKGFDQILLLGNDTPDLTEKLLNEALIQLRAGKNVVGPSTDGGTYLIGLQKKSFHPFAFEALPWKSEQLGIKLATLLSNQQNSVCYLKALADVDTKCQLLKLTFYHSVNKLKKWLLQALTRVFIQFRVYDLPKPLILLLIHNKGLRAPPFVY